MDLYLKSAIEGVVIKWASQIHDVLKYDTTGAEADPNAVPSVEIKFWNWRLRNLEFVYDQLRQNRVRSMAVILEKTNSAYYACFKSLFKNIVTGLTN